jgi:hypothetical protein
MERQDHLTEKELLEMRVRSTRIFSFFETGKLKSSAAMASRMKAEGKGEWSINKDYNSISISVTRKK